MKFCEKMNVIFIHSYIYIYIPNPFQHSSKEQAFAVIYFIFYTYFTYISYFSNIYKNIIS